MSSRKRHRTRYPGIFYRLEDESRPDGPRRYIVWYSDANGGEHTQTLPVGATLEDAQLLKGKLQARRASGETLLRSNQTVGELLDEWLESRKDAVREKTIEDYRGMVETHLKPAFGQRKVTELSPSDVARLIMKMKRAGLKTWTVKKALTPLSSAYAVAVRDGLVASSPTTKLLPHERPKGDQSEKRCLSTSEIDRLLSATESKRWKTLFSLLVFSGLRISEALALTWEDVTEDTISVRESKTEAGVREVMLVRPVRLLLNELKLSQAPGVQFVFATQQGAPVGRREALRALRAAEDKAGIPNYTLHELRHTYASLLIAQRETIPFIQKQMGHANPEITLRVYAKLLDAQESVGQAREKLQAVAGGIL